MDGCLIPGSKWWTHNSSPVTICERKSIPIPLISGQYFSSNVQALVFLCQLSCINLWKRILNTTALGLWHSHFLHWFQAAAVTPRTWFTDPSKWFHQHDAYCQISKPNLCRWCMVHHSGWHSLLLTISHFIQSPTVLLLTMQSPQTFLNVYEHSPLPPTQAFGTQ